MPPASYPYSTFLIDDLPTPNSRLYRISISLLAPRTAIPFVIGFMLTSVRHQIPRAFCRCIQSLHRILHRRLRNNDTAIDSGPDFLEAILSEATLDCAKCQNELLIPLVTPCGHTICAPCLLSLASARRCYCHVCDSRIRVEVGDLAENVTVKRLVDEKVNREGQKAWKEYRDAQKATRKALDTWTNRRRSFVERTVLCLKWLLLESTWLDFHIIVIWATVNLYVIAQLENKDQSRKQAILVEKSRVQEIEVVRLFSLLK